MGEVRTAGAHPKTAARRFADHVRLRAAMPGDIPALMPMINAAYKARDAWLFAGQRLEEQDLRDELDDERTTGIVADVDGALAGFAVVRQRGEHAEFGLLAVGLTFQGRGLAGMIIERAEMMAREAGCTEMQLGCIRENGLPPFYEALGYVTRSEELGSRWGSLAPFTLVEMRKALE